MSKRFQIISPTVLLFGERKYNVDKLPHGALLKVHKAILYFFPAERKDATGNLVKITHKGLESTLRTLRSLSDFEITRPDELDIYRQHILRFCMDWYERSRDMRLGPEMFYGGKLGNVDNEDIKPEVTAKSTIPGDGVLMDRHGGLSVRKGGSRESDLHLKDDDGGDADSEDADAEDTSSSIDALQRKLEELKRKLTFNDMFTLDQLADCRDVEDVNQRGICATISTRLSDIDGIIGFLRNIVDARKNNHQESVSYKQRMGRIFSELEQAVDIQRLDKLLEWAKRLEEAGGEE